MNYTNQININDNILNEAFMSVVDLAVLEETNKKIISDPEFKKGLNFIEALRKAEITLGFDAMLNQIELL